MFKRISFFIFVNILVLITITTITTLLGVPRYIGDSGYLALLAFSVIAGFSGAIISLLFSRIMAKWIMGVKLIDVRSPQNERLNFVIEETYRLAKLAGLKKMPQIGVYDSVEVNAFATGPSKRRSLVAVSSGMINSMDRPAISGVLAHEIAHIKNGDMVTTTLLQGIINTFVIFFSRLVAKIVSNFVREELSYVVYVLCSIVFEIVFSILSSPIIFWYSRKREFKADQYAAEIGGKDNMIYALESLRSNIRLIDDRQKSIAAFKISGKEKFARLFSTHPPLEKRIERLKSL
ncbi:MULTISPECIES: protease HtpX [unclassified Bacillus (in: firmicutes)]|uniref:protease HtpX n=1 Tax=unclassified Bacillus (in: firmicutes) TaxID=185979 RepID=UPI000BF09B81|nr:MULTISPECIES: protease HtpX [unclassified Bacillus (in: firmicutes)]PEJ56149.1 protease HtpX [Bacillus sp. AFS002410]PEK97864.1 protease HtpX [Bacillus sp. AFS017336]